ncbi:hypothetical protein ACWF7H_18820 [Peribacillus butanolivorans]|uniref:hypothetical protein n=1 Tax=Peribacillus butanolivorans TaxID=421767 RepID=UPI0036CFAD17
MNHFFIIEGCSDTGNYVIFEGKRGTQENLKIHTVNNRKKGLKECRQYIGNYLKFTCGYALNQVIPHQCVKPDRLESKNPWHRNCTVQDYIDGIDPAKKAGEVQK